MSPANIVNSDLTRRLYNPHLLVNGINSISDDHYLSKSKEYDELKRLYSSAIEETSNKNLVYSLNVDYSNTDKGLGGFFDAGFVGYFMSKYDGQDTKRIEKDLNFYWPKVPNSDKFMSYLGSINLGVWPMLFRLMTRKKYEKESYSSFWDFTGLGRDDSFLSFRDDTDFWMHLFVGEQNDFETTVPDCHVRITQQFKSTIDDKKDYEIHPDWISAIKEFQELRTVKTSIKAPKKYFGSITPEFKFDGLKVPKQYEYKDAPKNSVFGYSKGDCQVYGAPWSQQIPKRYVSPESYFWRGCAPMFAFYDDDSDTTHQFYADSLVMDSIYHTRYYCKLDSSCT